MGVEIERKFLVANSDWQKESESWSVYLQGYFPGKVTTRVRIKSNKIAELTIKGDPLDDNKRAKSEYNYDIPLSDAYAMLTEFCMKRIIKKLRYQIKHGRFTWEIDEFIGRHRGLVVAEIELDYFDQEVELPSWVGREVTGDNRFSNRSLATHGLEQIKDEI